MSLVDFNSSAFWSDGGVLDLPPDLAENDARLTDKPTIDFSSSSILSDVEGPPRIDLPAQHRTDSEPDASKVGVDWLEVAKPDAFVVGYTQKPLPSLGQWNSVLTGNFALFGHESTTLFHSHVVDKWPVGSGLLTSGLVGTWNKTTNDLEGGLGVGYKVDLFGVDTLLFANGRVNQSVLAGDGNFTISGNVGAAFSASDLAVKGLSYMGGPTTRVAIPEAMNALDKTLSPDIWTGAAWRGELEFHDGKPDSLNLSGQHLPLSALTDLWTTPVQTEVPWDHKFQNMGFAPGP